VIGSQIAFPLDKTRTIADVVGKHACFFIAFGAITKLRVGVFNFGARTPAPKLIRSLRM